MQLNEQLNELKGFLTQKQCFFKENEPLAPHTSFKVGGPADLWAEPLNERMLAQIIAFCTAREIPVTVLGNGSNVLVSDLGVAGAVLHIGGGFCEKERLSAFELRCGAGTKLSVLCSFALENELGGLEFAWGIPGTAGGALYMNAGAYGSEMANVVTECSCVLTDGRTEVLPLQKLKLGYRTCLFKEKKNRIITAITYRLAAAPPAEIRGRMEQLMARRREKQPLEYPSAGSTFKRPAGHFAGSLIESCGLKGFTVGGAAVSEKHAGFVINKGGATAGDIRSLIEQVQEKVFLETSVRLEPEVEFIGR